MTEDEKTLLDKFAAMGGLQRKLIPLQDGEQQPNYALDNCPDGFRFETDAELRNRALTTHELAYASTEQYFRDKILEVDPSCEVQFDIEVPMAVRIRRISTPMHRDVLREQANLYRPIGLAVSIVKEVDDWGWPEKKSWLKRFLLWLVEKV